VVLVFETEKRGREMERDGEGERERERERGEKICGVGSTPEVVEST